jgi:hypothetical protein
VIQPARPSELSARSVTLHWRAGPRPGGLTGGEGGGARDQVDDADRRPAAAERVEVADGDAGEAAVDGRHLHDQPLGDEPALAHLDATGELLAEDDRDAARGVVTADDPHRGTAAPG